jgi:hypothetical protein
MMTRYMALEFNLRGIAVDTIVPGGLHTGLLWGCRGFSLLWLGYGRDPVLLVRGPPGRSPGRADDVVVLPQGEMALE